MKTRFIYSAIILTASVLMWGCGDSGKDDNGKKPSDGDPVIFNLDPQTAFPGDAVAVNGVDFGSVADNVTVAFGGGVAKVVSVTDTKITFTVPDPPADMTGFDIDVSITVGSNTSNEYRFTYECPKVAGYGYHVGFPGEELELKGSGFRSTPEANKVTFGVARADVLEASADRLLVRVPKSDAAKVALCVSSVDFPILQSGDTDFEYDTDATALAGLKWTVDSSMDGVVCRYVETTMFNSKQAIAVLEVPLGDEYGAGLGLPAPLQAAATTTICKGAGAFGGVNGGYFHMASPMEWWDYSRAGGKDVVTTNKVRVITGDPAVNGAMVIKNGKDISFRRVPTNTNQEAMKLSGDDVLVAGPILMLKGEMETIRSSSHNDDRHPRTAVGVTANSRLLLVAVDGRTTTAAGMTNHEHAKLMRLLGAYEAMALDGGGSTTLYFKDWSTSGVVNTPSGGMQRNVANAVCVWKKE